jgi:hypothetical protein
MELSALIARAAMKERFPAAPRNSWRRRFLAIARELEAAGKPRRDSLDTPRPRPRPAFGCR